MGTYLEVHFSARPKLSRKVQGRTGEGVLPNTASLCYSGAGVPGCTYALKFSFGLDAFVLQDQYKVLAFKALNESGHKYLKDRLLHYRPPWVFKISRGSPLACSAALKS